MPYLNFLGFILNNSSWINMYLDFCSTTAKK